MKKFDEMEASRELDALISEKVMRCKQANCPNYSTDIASAWAAAEEVELFRWCDITQDDNGWIIDNVTHDWQVEAETAPLAICRAALKML